jgi:outer membrane beta-barrel protein
MGPGFDASESDSPAAAGRLDTELAELNRPQAMLLALCLAPVLALAQDTGLGLDLSDESQKPQEEEQEKDPLASDAPAEEPPPLSTAEPPAAEPLLPAEREVTMDDRVKSVQRKVYLKRSRFELAPFVTVSVNDPYYSKVGATVRGAWYLADTLAIAGRFSALGVVPTDDVSTAKRTFGGRIFYSVPQWVATGNVEWSPIYGKVAFLNSILHFDAYVLGGLGAVRTETSALPGRGLNLAADLGLGVRFVTRDWLAVNVALINTSYVDQPLNSSKGATQNMLTLNAGVSVFLPFKSTGREAE